MTTDHPKFCIHTALQLIGLTTEKFLPTALELHSVGFCQVKVYKCEKFGSHFSCQSLLLGTNVPNDSNQNYLDFSYNANRLQ